MRGPSNSVTVLAEQSCGVEANEKGKQRNPQRAVFICYKLYYNG